METKNQWHDTGRDCPSCGGVILRRKDHLPDGSISIYNQCRTCEAQWSKDWQPLREGRPELLTGERGTRRLERLPAVPRWVWITLGLMFLFITFRLGGGVVLRLLLVPLGVGLMVWLIFRLGQDQGWWSF